MFLGLDEQFVVTAIYVTDFHCLNYVGSRRSGLFHARHFKLSEAHLNILGNSCGQL